MKRDIAPGARSGRVKIPSSKSQAHRLLICAALGKSETRISCDGISQDIAATIACLEAMGAAIESRDGALFVKPIDLLPQECHLHCGESGSTLRFLLPIVGALGLNAVFHMEGRLPQRPLAPLDAELRRQGMEITSDGDRLYCSGRLRPGTYSVAGNVSSQYISGLLMALPLLCGDSELEVSGEIESAAYISMTEDVISRAGIKYVKTDNAYKIEGGQRPQLLEELSVEGDYSNAAFFLCIGALSEKGMEVSGLSEASRQGDRAVLDILHRFGAEMESDKGIIKIKRGELLGCTIDAAAIPDLIPVLSVLASVAKGETRVINAARLRLKESDRLRSTCAMLKNLGADIEELEDGLIIRGRDRLCGGSVDSCGDHRIAMSAAVAACACTGRVELCGSGCVSKSYPSFWEHFDALTGGGL